MMDHDDDNDDDADDDGDDSGDGGNYWRWCHVK